MTCVNVGRDKIKSLSNASLNRLLDVLVFMNEREILARWASMDGGTASDCAVAASIAGAAAADDSHSATTTNSG